jgi:Fur family iron response transcriptional regulator
MSLDISDAAADVPAHSGRPAKAPSETSQEVRARLAAAGLKLTRQRLALAELLFARGDRHLTAEMLHEEARRMRHPPSVATVYNTLHNFAEHGLLREIAVYGRQIWFDTKTGPHFHFYLEAEDRLFDMPDEMIPRLDIRPPAGTVVAGIDVVIRLKQAPPRMDSSSVGDRGEAHIGGDGATMNAASASSRAIPSPA